MTGHHAFARWLLVVFLGSSTLILGACTSAEDPAEQQAERRTKRLDELARKREARQEELQDMDVSELARQLASDSERGREAFNSLVYAEAVSRGREAATALRDELRKADRSSLLGLLAVREIDRATYRGIAASFRTEVLIAALRTSPFYNSWGLPHAYWEAAANALIGEGKAAVNPLSELLDDERLAPMWGSEEVVESRRYGYRVKDYAWAILLEILDRKRDIPVEAKDRDPLIEELRSQL